MYYIWSLIATLTIFSVLQYNEYTKQVSKNLPYHLYTFSNLSTVIIMYLMLTIMFYMLLSTDHTGIKQVKGKGTKSGGATYDDMNMYLDPVMLRRIPDQVYTGFYPYDTDTDV